MTSVDCFRRGRYVTIARPDISNDHLSLAELEIMALGECLHYLQTLNPNPKP